MELAALLKVSRSHISMYECGKRSLPTASILKLTELLAAPQPSVKAQAVHSQSMLREEILKMIAENEFAQLAMEKKLEKAKREEDTLVRRSALKNYLGDHPYNNDSRDSARTVLKAKASDPLLVPRLEFKMKMLQNELAFLKKEAG